MAEYIERDEILKYPIRINHYDKEHGNEDFVLGIESVIEYVKYIPAADVEPVVHAKWIPQNVNRLGRTDIFECSECNKAVHTLHKSYRCLDLYCSNCGAKMDYNDK